MRNLLRIFIFLLYCSCSNSRPPASPVSDLTPEAEIMYHVVQRSFYDSNGDRIGDLNGLREKLDYLQELGVTSVLLLPLYQSVYYHNYFASDFEKIDSTLGTCDDYINLVKDIHRRGMKIYMDMETQYVTQDHLWYRDSYGNLNSQFSDYIAYDDSAHKKPSTIVFNLEGLKGYNGVYRRITTVNLNSDKVKAYNYKLFKHWTDPNGDGDFTDGVDGFRLDHAMDNLDNKGRWTHLFQHFWKPLIDSIKNVNPKVIFMAEQADWGSFGIDYFTKADVDRVFAFRISFEIRNLNKEKLEKVADSIFSLTPPGKNQIIFIENHDMPRFASVVNGNPGKLKVGAALNILFGGIPSVYYGQEIGMKGKALPGRHEFTDGNEIPYREAFEWYKTDSGKGMAYWYKDSGPWWDSSSIRANDGVSLEEQLNDSASLWNYYKKLITIRKEYSPLFKGTYHTVKNDNDSVFSFIRKNDKKAILMVTNFSPKNESVSLGVTPDLKASATREILNNGMISLNSKTWTMALKPFAVCVLELTNP